MAALFTEDVDAAFARDDVVDQRGAPIRVGDVDARRPRAESVGGDAPWLSAVAAASSMSASTADRAALGQMAARTPRRCPAPAPVTIATLPSSEPGTVGPPWSSVLRDRMRRLRATSTWRAGTGCARGGVGGAARRRRRRAPPATRRSPAWSSTLCFRSGRGKSIGRPPASTMLCSDSERTRTSGLCDAAAIAQWK